MKPIADIVGIDILWYDEIVTLKELPKDNGSAFVQNLSIQGGGKVCTALAAAGRLGVSCKLLAVSGQSERSRFLVEDLKKHNVNTDAIYKKEGYEEGFSIILSDEKSGGRRILWRYNSSQTGLEVCNVQGIQKDIQTAKFLHLCRLDAVECKAAQYARSMGTRVCLDADFFDEDFKNETRMQALQLVDVLIGSQEFYEGFYPQGDFEDNLRDMQKKGPQDIIFTFGKDGCRGIADGEYFEQAAFSENINVVDTVGAGDVFHGAYLAALCQGQSARQAARYAAACSAIKCTAIGGRAGIPSHKVLMRYLQNGKLDATEILQRVNEYQL